jgi:dihydrofolate reductase
VVNPLLSGGVKVGPVATLIPKEFSQERVPPIVGVAVSLDGFSEGPNGEYDWCLTEQDYGLSEFFKRVDTLFMGRKTYEMSLGMEGGGAGFPKFKEYVFSTTLTTTKEGVIIIHDDVKSTVEKIKNEPGKDIWLFGGAGLITSLVNEQLVDEISLAVHPIILGAGKPLFSDIKQRINLELMDSKTYSTGLITLNYMIKEK